MPRAPRNSEITTFRYCLAKYKSYGILTSQKTLKQKMHQFSKTEGILLSQPLITKETKL